MTEGACLRDPRCLMASGGGSRRWTAKASQSRIQGLTGFVSCVALGSLPVWLGQSRTGLEGWLVWAVGWVCRRCVGLVGGDIGESDGVVGLAWSEGGVLHEAVGWRDAVSRVVASE
ncbi:hypothetical protein GCM10010402_45400 [Actinomadura luteofluorescens]